MIISSNINLYLKTVLLLFFILITLFVTTISCLKDGAVTSEEGYYTCSMHPQVIQQEPGNCPICEMNLTFVPEEKEKSKDTHDGHEMEMGSKKKKAGFFQFSLAKNLLQNANVYTVPTKKVRFTRTKTFSGHIDYNEDPDRLVIINTKYEGWIEKLYVSKEGQHINKNERLMGIYSQKILAAKEEYLTTYQSLIKNYSSQGINIEDLRKDPTLIASHRKLIYLDVPSFQISLIETSGKTDRLTYFRSPISGILIKKDILQGSYIKTGQELFRIANLKILWVFIHIFEKDLPFIKKGQGVTIQTYAYPEKPFTGKIDLIYPFLDMKTRDVRVRIVVPNDKLLLKPGMFASVKVKSTLPGKVITIPELAIIYSGEKNYVFASVGDGNFEVRPIVVLTRSEGKAVISRGLKKNELIVANSQFLLDSEASLKEAIQKGQLTGHQH